MKTSNASLRLALAAGLTLGAMPAAFAAGTAAGTDITNTASVDFEVDGVNQPDVTSNSTTFNVDRKINLTVAETGSADTNVVPGAQDQVLTFTVTNNSNSTLDFRLAATQDATSATTAHSDTDAFDVTGVSVFVESGATAGYQALEDTATFIDELAADGVVTVYIVADIPSGQTNNQTAGLTLTAYAAQSTNGTTGDYVATATTLAADATETNVGVADDATFVDTVFGDVAGDTDAATDGAHSDDDEYEVVTATIVMTKSSRVVTDPFNCSVEGDNTSCTSTPKAIPGAIVEYCLDVNNTGASAAGSIVVTDAAPTNTTYYPGSIRSATTGTGSACDIEAGTAEDDNSAGADETDTDGGNFTTPNITVTTPTISASSRWKSSFQVKVD